MKKFFEINLKNNAAKNTCEQGLVVQVTCQELSCNMSKIFWDLLRNHVVDFLKKPWNFPSILWKLFNQPTVYSTLHQTNVFSTQFRNNCITKNIIFVLFYFMQLLPRVSETKRKFRLIVVSDKHWPSPTGTMWRRKFSRIQISSNRRVKYLMKN